MMISFDRDTPRGLVAAAVLFAVLGRAPDALAVSEQDRRTAQQELTSAQTLKKEGKLQEALSHLEESQRLDPKLPTLMELADCAEQLGKLVEAQAHWTAARDQAKKEEKPQSRQKATERLAAVEKRVARLTVQLASNAPADAQVSLDGAPLDRAALGTALAADPGDHVVVVKAAGHDDATFSVKLAEGDSQTLPVAPTPKAAPPPPPPPPPPPKAAPPPKAVEQDSASLSLNSGSSQRTIGLVVGAVGVVGAGVGAGFWAVGYRDRGRLGFTADRQMLFGKVSVIAGGALLATGVVLFMTAPSGDTKTARLPVVPTLSVASDSTVLGAAGEF
jgi:hypothetical protein